MNFWTTWCTACVGEMPALVALQKKHGDKLVIIGVSLDSIERLNSFSADPQYCAGKLAVASDPDGMIARSYQLKVDDASPGAKDTRGVDIGHGFAARVTFVVLPEGKVAAEVGGVSPFEHVQKALAIVQKLHDGK